MTTNMIQFIITIMEISVLYGFLFYSLQRMIKIYLCFAWMLVVLAIVLSSVLAGYYGALLFASAIIN